MMINQMKVLVSRSLLGALCFYLSGVNLSAQVAVDAATAKSAQAAVEKMGFEMMKGNFGYAHERMYPRWKRRLAARSGGIDKLNTKLAASLEQNNKMKVNVTSLRALMPTTFFSVWRSKKIDDRTGQPIKNSAGNFVVVEHWLAIVPTITRVKIPDPNKGGVIRELEENGYTVAISEKGSNQWYFMAGLKPTPQDLRGMFPSLPADTSALGLPASSMREIK